MTAEALDLYGEVITEGRLTYCKEPLAIEEGETYTFELDGRKRPLTLTCECSGRAAFKGLRQIIFLTGGKASFYTLYRDYKGGLELCHGSRQRRIGQVLSITKG